MKTVTMSLEQYEALAALAREGRDANKLREVNAFLKDIEKANGITRSFLFVQWQEAGSALPPTTRFPNKWPPELRFSLERTDRAISRADVEAVLATKARRPVTVLVTTDPGGELGWMPLADYFKG